MVSAHWLLATALVLGLGCSDECHDIGCGTSLIIELAPEQGFEDGAYEVTIDSPAGSELCSFEIAGGNASGLSCSPQGPSLDSGELPSFVLVRYYQSFPETLSVAVARDGEELARQDFTPEYEQVVVDPNACGGPCTAAQVSLAF